MAEHTPEPWAFVPWHIEEGPSAVRAPAGHLVCNTASDIDARRIVACVNACAGIPIEFLESGGVAKLVEAASALIANRDANCFEQEEFKTGGPYGDYWSPHSSMVDSEAIAGLRNILTQLNPQHAEALTKEDSNAAR